MVLDCMRKYFKKGFSGNYGIKMSSGKYTHYMSWNGPPLASASPPRGTLDLLTVQAIYRVVAATPRHPDQFP